MNRYALTAKLGDTTVYVVAGTSPSVTENQAEATIYDDRDTLKTKERFFSAILGFPVVTTAVS